MNPRFFFKFAMISGRIGKSGLLLLLLAWAAGPALANPAGRETLVIPPAQITSRTDPVLDMAISADGTWIVYVSGPEKPTSLWLGSADPMVIILPEKLADGASAKSNPAISADGRYVAYVDTDHDVKGDIYVLDREKPGKSPLRLTGRDTEDGGPCFSPDGRFLYFHQASGNGARKLSVMDLRHPETGPKEIPTGGDASFCALSPDQRLLAFVSVRGDVSGDLFLMETKTQIIRQITGGPAIDMYPAWSPDGRTLHFSRIGSDTSHDGRLTPEDTSVICRMQVDLPDGIPFPVTPLSFGAFKPATAGGRIYFLSDRGGVSNCWCIPESGMIRPERSASAQLETARKIADIIPYDPYLALLAHVAVVESFPDQREAAQAGLRAADIFAELDLPASAAAACRFVRAAFAGDIPEAVLAEIRQIGIEVEMARKSEPNAARLQEFSQNALARLKEITETHPGRIGVAARLESIRLLITETTTRPDFSKALEWAETVAENDAADAHQRAEALYRKAEILRQTATAAQVRQTLRKILLDHPDSRRWSDKAVDRYIDSVLSDFALDDPEKKIEKLRQTAEENKIPAPALSMGALNRIGDLYYAAGDFGRARDAYRYVLDTFPELTSRTAAARLSLAEIYFQEEQFRKAIDLYEAEIRLREPADRIYHLARQGYIRKTVAAGEFYFHQGEIPMARAAFKELLDYDADIVEAHRGYIKCAAAAGDLESLLSRYRKALRESPDDPVLLYATGLCLTYRETEDAAREAEKLIQKALRYNGGIAYFHQTLGYVHEIMETVYGEPRALEQALQSYQKAYFLNDPARDPENAAHLTLNLGNVYYLLGQYGKAMEFYERRRASTTEFSDPTARIVFLKRLGECAFQNNEIQTAVSAYTEAIGLIDARIDPIAPSRAFERVNRYVSDRIIASAAGQEPTKAMAEALAESQSALHLLAMEYTGTAAPPPSERWRSYRKNMEALLDRQEALQPDAVKLAKRFNALASETPGAAFIAQPGENLTHLLRQARQALDFPERLMELKAEISDRLALAFQETQNWEKAAETFAQVYDINEKTGKTENLARNRRAVAYATYQLAQTLTGERRTRLLEKAQGDFRKVLDLMDRFGVPAPAEAKKNALVNLTFQASLDSASATEAARGFSEVQERRLAETFLARIDLELGHLRSSREMLEKQLAAAPLPSAVPEKDRFGISLLYHRAGILDHATGDDPAAVEKFAASAALCLKLKNPKSAAVNLENLAAVAGPDQAARLRPLDRETSALLHENVNIIGLEPVLKYHAILGVFYFKASRAAGQDLSGMTDRVLLAQTAVGHFSRGIRLFTEASGGLERDVLEAGTVLHLNLAAAAAVSGDADTARDHFQKALDLSTTGIFPDLKWRALLGLGKPLDAWAALETVSLFRAGCGPGEIVAGFSSLVFDQLDAGDAEKAFSLAEKISETERFHRTAAIVRPDGDREKQFFRELFPRLEKIQTLETETAKADSVQKPLLEKRLKAERLLLAEALGPNLENLPASLREIRDAETRNTAIRLLALAAEIDATQNLLAKENIRVLNAATGAEKSSARAEEFQRSADALAAAYQTICEEAFFSRPASAPPDFLAFLFPEPYGPMDIMEILPEDDAMARIFHSGIPGEPFALFVVTPEDITGCVLPTIGAVKEKISEEIDWTLPYLAHENPLSFTMPDADADFPRALSGVHLLRCINSRKPFKQKLLVVPQTSLADFPDQGDAVQTPSPDPLNLAELEKTLPAAHVLVLANGPEPAATAPTEPGQTARPFFAVQTDPDTRAALEHLLARSANLSLSLALAAGSPGDPLYTLGHLFSLYGCPSLVFLESDPTGEQTPAAAFLRFYAEKSGWEAFCATLTENAPEAINSGLQPALGSRSLYLGYQGMNRGQSAAFAKKQFVDYVKSGRNHFDRGNFTAATVDFENAIAVAEEISVYDRYLPDLYKYARESAYRGGDNQKALGFAAELAGLMADVSPNSKAHAEALLRLGLMHAKAESYPEAVTAMESAVDILETLPPDPEWIAAISDLGIVLENATHYESALSRFRSAADLSRELDQSRLLGEQHLHMGRIYDLRLNQYAEAIKEYEKALDLFLQSDDVEKIAESRLNIGRCHRLLGNFPRADQYYAESLKLLASRAPESHLLLAKIRMEQANTAWFQGNYETALKLQRGCYETARAHDFPLLQVMALNTAGLIWWTLGDYDKALSELHDALDHARRLSIREDEISSTLNNMGLIHRDRGDHEKALEIFEQAVAIDTKLGSKWGLAYDFRNQGLTYLKMNQPEKAVALFDEAFRLADSIGNRINAAKALLGKSEALLILKNYAEAEKTYDQALAMSRDMRLAENIWRALFGKAKIQMEAHQHHAAAESLLREAVTIIENLRSDLKIERLRENFLTDKLTVYETLVRLLADTGKPVAAFEMAERSRSRNFIDLLGSGPVHFQDAAETELYRKQHLLRSEIAAHESLMASASPTEAAVYGKALESLRRDLENLMVDMQLKNPQLASLVSVPPVRTQDLVQWLEPGVAVLSYYLLDDEIFCWILSRAPGAEMDGDDALPVKLVRIPADRGLLEKHILEYRRIIQNLEPWEKHARLLHDQLMAPIRPYLTGIQTLGIIPHGSLHYLSFATLYSNENFLVEEFSFFYLPSAGVLEYTLSRRGTEPKTIPKVLAIGNPDLGDPLLDLPFAEQEVTSIQWNFPEVTLLTRENATKAWVVENISRFNIVHFASHGEFDPMNPLLSAIKLAAGPDKDFTNSADHGNLAAGEIFGLKIKADMVFLSACQTGLGKITAGDDVIGLNRSFFYAGTHTVVSSLWRVSDVSTAVLIKTFYRSYMTLDKADSLKRAALHVKSRYPHPGYWGAFTLVGDYR